MDFTKGICMGCMSNIGEEQICPVCGYDNLSPDNGAGLPVRTLLGKYVIGKVLDSGGEGITYIGKNTETGESVRIREFFPAGLCERNANGTVDVKKENAFSFNEALLSFLELARSLSSFKGNPNLLNVIDIFEAGNTAYYITENVSGITLREFLLRNGGQLTWEQARSLFLPLFPVLGQLHSANIIHRGLSPETLIVGRDGKVRITGFCIASARTARSDIPARLFPGFAAIEQYGFDAKSGPWTDVYGLAATLFRTIIGNPPPEATERVSHDNMTVPAKMAEELPKSVLAALANALQIMPENRTNSINAFKEALVADGVAATNRAESPAKGGTFFQKYGVLTIAITATVLLIIIAIFVVKGLNSGSKDNPNGADLSVETNSRYIVNDDDEVAKVIDFTGKTCAEVMDYYKEQGFGNIQLEVVGKEHNSKYRRGAIYKQEAKSGTEIGVEDTLKVYVSLGPKEVKLPNFLKDKTSYLEARVALLELGFLPENIVGTGVTKLGVDEDRVFEMEPKGGSMVSIESKVELSYYMEIEDIVVEDFVGMDYNEEIKGNMDYSAYQFTIKEEYSEVIDKGIVIEQSVTPGAKVDNTEIIQLVVSRGEPPIMISLVNWLEDDAVRYLKRNGVKYSIEKRYSNVAKNRVIETTPRKGETILGKVTIVISKGPQPVASSAPSATTSDSGSTSTPSTSSQQATSSVISTPTTSTPAASQPTEPESTTSSEAANTEPATSSDTTTD